MDRQTLEFYQDHSAEWTAAVPHEWSPHLDHFLDRLAPDARILELGCGDGRDAQHMIGRGFSVDPSDGSPVMAGLASDRLKRPVPVMRFDELSSEAVYDAAWCHASLLHLTEAELVPVLAAVFRALKPGGWHFSCFKGGDGGHRDQFGRFYSYIPAERLEAAYRDAGEWSELTVETKFDGRSFGGTPTDWHNVTARK